VSGCDTDSGNGAYENESGSWCGDGVRYRSYFGTSLARSNGMTQSEKEALRREAEHWHNEVDRLQKELGAGQSRDKMDQLYGEIGRATAAYSRVWEHGSTRKYQCPCCDLYTLDEEPPGTFEICMVCWWEDDLVQFHDPTYGGGANRESLIEAREAFRRRGIIGPH